MAYWLNPCSTGNGRPDGPRMVLHAEGASRKSPSTACGRETSRTWFWFKAASYCDEWWEHEADQTIPLTSCRQPACVRRLKRMGLPRCVAAVNSCRR